MIYAATAVVATSIAIFEVCAHRKSRPMLQGRALLWWGLRIVLELVVAFAALIVLKDRLPEAWPSWLVGATAGVSGSVAARSRLLSLASAQGVERPVGIALAYEPVRNYLQERLLSPGAQRDTTWINHHVLPTLERAGILPEAVADRLLGFVKRMSMGESKILFVKAMVNKPDASDHEKLRDLLDAACCDLRAFQIVEDLYKEAWQQVNEPEE
jgi:hypothetical protein